MKILRTLGSALALTTLSATLAACGGTSTTCDVETCSGSTNTYQVCTDGVVVQYTFNGTTCDNTDSSCGTALANYCAPAVATCDPPTPAVEDTGTTSYSITDGAAATPPAGQAAYVVTATSNNDGTSTWALTILDDSNASDCFTGYIFSQGAFASLTASANVSTLTDANNPNQITFGVTGPGSITFISPNDVSSNPADVYFDVSINGAAPAGLYYPDNTSGNTEQTAGGYVAFNIQ